MKFLCEQCHELMALEGIKGSTENLTHITFCCPECKNRISMINNPQETQLVRSLGVNIGGRKVPPQPLELVRTTLAHKGKDVLIANVNSQNLEDGKESLIWTREAKKRMEKIPETVREMAKRTIEGHARQKGYEEITSDVIDEAKSQWGDMM